MLTVTPANPGSRTKDTYGNFYYQQNIDVIKDHLILVGGYATSNLNKLLTNRFSVPGSDAEKGLNILQTRFGERSDGAFTLVFQSTGSTLSPAAAETAARRAAGAIRGGKAGPPRPAGP